MSEFDGMIALLGDFAPHLAQVFVAATRLANKLKTVRENKNQCIYLVTRTTLVSQALASIEKGRLGSAKTQGVAPSVAELSQMIYLIERIIDRQSNAKKLQSFMQRQDTAKWMQAAHKAVDDYIEGFLRDQRSDLAFSKATHDEAERQDMEILLSALESVWEDGEGILGVLGIRREQQFDTIQDLKNSLGSNDLDRLQKAFITRSYNLLMKNWLMDPMSCAYEWAISVEEVKITGVRIGHGGSAQVLLGTWNGTEVAVKRLQKEMMPQGLIKEIRIWRTHQHDNVAAFYKACIDPRCMFLVSQFYKFGDIINYLKLYPGANRQQLLLDVALGMNYLHSKDVIHADLKPENVLIDDAHRARICDFGISRIKITQSALTVPGSTGPALEVPGTPVYMAPERLRRGSMTRATDVYAFAMTGYHIYAEEYPFQYLPKGISFLFDTVVTRRTRPLKPEVDRGLTEEVWELIQRGWDDDPKQRPTFEGLVDSLKTLKRRALAPTHHPPASPGATSAQTILFPSVTSILDVDAEIALLKRNPLKRTAVIGLNVNVPMTKKARLD